MMKRNDDDDDNSSRGHYFFFTIKVLPLLLYTSFTPELKYSSHHFVTFALNFVLKDVLQAQFVLKYNTKIIHRLSINRSLLLIREIYEREKLIYNSTSKCIYFCIYILSFSFIFYMDRSASNKSILFSENKDLGYNSLNSSF
jgi:hypothetical protein